MAYVYEAEREKLFTESGQRQFLKVRDAVNALIKHAGAFRQAELHVGGGDSWEILACLDRMVELGEIVKLRPEGSCWAQYQVYTTPQVHNY